MNTTAQPRIVGKLLEADQKLDRADLDKERLCYLVSDEEWLELVGYIERFEYREYLREEKVVTMRFCGLEVIKRSAVQLKGVE